eukprot:8780624-Alexandrium_andersonii.AAC.1
MGCSRLPAGACCFRRFSPWAIMSNARQPPSSSGSMSLQGMDYGFSASSSRLWSVQLVPPRMRADGVGPEWAMRARSWALPTVDQCRDEASTTAPSTACRSADVFFWRFPEE